MSRLRKLHETIETITDEQDALPELRSPVVDRVHFKAVHAVFIMQIIDEKADDRPGSSSGSSGRPPSSGRSAIGLCRKAADIRPRTFSMTNIFGFNASMNRRNCHSSVPLGSWTVPRFPVVLNVWQGGPPTRRSMSPGFMSSLARSSLGESSLMSPSNTARSRDLVLP